MIKEKLLTASPVPPKFPTIAGPAWAPIRVTPSAIAFLRQRSRNDWA